VILQRLRTGPAADELEVATTETMLDPTARGTGTPSTRVRKGMIRTPPPNPNKAPMNPATIETRKITRTSTGPSTIVLDTFNILALVSSIKKILKPETVSNQV